MNQQQHAARTELLRFPSELHILSFIVVKRSSLFTFEAAQCLVCVHADVLPIIRSARFCCICHENIICFSPDDLSTSITFASRQQQDGLVWPATCSQHNTKMREHANTAQEGEIHEGHHTTREHDELTCIISSFCDFSHDSHDSAGGMSPLSVWSAAAIWVPGTVGLG